MSLSVVVPAYNEADRIAGPLREIGDWLASLGDSELIVVDDGSSDGTAELVARLARELTVPVRVLRHSPNRGKGFALKAGFAASRGRRVLFTDADLSTPLAEASRLLARVDAGADVVIGSRKTAGSYIEVHQKPLREWMGWVFTWIVRNAIADVTDATCGFKAFRGEAGRDLFARLRVYDWSFDAELLLLARRLGYRLEEVPVRWADRAGTKVSVARDALRSLHGLLRIRLNDARGLYASEHPTEAPSQLWYTNIDAEECPKGEDRRAS